MISLSLSDTVQSIQYFLQKIDKQMQNYRSLNSLSPQLQPYSFVNSSIHLTRPDKTSNLIEKMNLKKINEYLEQKISKKVMKNKTQAFKRDQQEQQHHYKPYTIQKESFSNHLQYSHKERLNQSRFNQPNASLPPQPLWKKHQSIDKLLQKKYVNKEDGRKLHIEPENHQSQEGLYKLEKKYQELQGKYKRLMQDASQEARQYQQTKHELNLLKQKRFKNQNTLSILKKELLELNGSSSHNHLQNQKQILPKTKSQLKLQPDISTIQSYMQNNKQWSAINESEMKIRNNSIKNSRVNKTSQSWTKNHSQNKKSYQTEQKSLQKPERYYSATKLIEDKRLGKSVRNSEDYNYGNGESKISIKLSDNLRKSLVRNCIKPSTQTIIRFQAQSSKCITPTNLHKKVINSNLYSKYRFQPTLKIS